MPAFGREFFRRHRQRVERGGDERAGAGIKRKIAPLLDQRARQRLGENAFGKAERERFAFAFVAGFVAGDKRHRHFGAGPGMVGEVLDGLPDAAFGARLRQHQRELGRTEQRTSGIAFRRRLVLARKGRARLGDPIIVLEPVGQQERAARLLLGILGERDRRRLVGNDVERPGQVFTDAAQSRGSGRRDLEPILLRASGRLDFFVGRRDAAGAGNVEIELARRAHDERAAGRNGYRLARVRVLPRDLAGMHAGEDDRRLAGISGRRHPGVDAEIRRQHNALPIERRRDALPMLATGGDEGGDRGDENKTAQRIGIAQRKPGRRPSRPERAGLGKRALDMRSPERERIGICRRDGEFVGDRRRRPMANAAAAIEPAQRVDGGRQAQRNERNDRARARGSQTPPSRPRARAAATKAKARATTQSGKDR